MYQIISDGSCDLDSSIVKKAQLEIVPFYISIDGKNHQKEIEELKIRDFYQFMIDNPKVFPKTSLPSIKNYLEAFTPLVEKNIDIICICITTKFSGSYNSAMSAKEVLLEEYPSATITIIDATVNTVLQGLLVLEAVKMQEQGCSYQEVIDTIESIKSTGRIFFTIGSMDYLVHGGRVGKLAGIAAGTLGLKPLIVLENGEINKAGVVRGRKISKKKIIELTLQHLQKNNINPNDYEFTIGYGYDIEEGKECMQSFITALKESYPDYTKSSLPVRQIGATIGVHTGPHPLGIGLIKKCCI